MSNEAPPASPRGMNRPPSFKDLRRLSSQGSQAIGYFTAADLGTAGGPRTPRGGAASASDSAALAAVVVSPIVAAPAAAAAAVETKVIELASTKEIAASEAVTYAKPAELKRTENGLCIVRVFVMQLILLFS